MPLSVNIYANTVRLWAYISTTMWCGLYNFQALPSMSIAECIRNGHISAWTYATGDENMHFKLEKVKWLYWSSKNNISILMCEYESLLIHTYVYPNRNHL